MDWYDKVLDEWINRDVRLLEIGIHRGGSLLLWRDYFPRGIIAGLDLCVPDSLANEERIRVFKGSQCDTEFLSDIARKVAPDGLDVIIDDASHCGWKTKISFWHLFDNHLKPSGLFVIEDWGTGYWADWADGKMFRPASRLRSLWQWGRERARMPRFRWHNHSYGMVGLIKQLVDEQGAEDLTRARNDGTPTRRSKFESLLITPSVVFIRKARDGSV